MVQIHCNKISPSGFNLLGQISFASLFLMHPLSLIIMEWHAASCRTHNSSWFLGEHYGKIYLLSVFSSVETHEGLMVGLALAQTHRRWNIYAIVEEFTPRSKVALQYWLDVCRGETLDGKEQRNNYKSIHIAFHADTNSFKDVWSAEWEEVFALMKDKELPFFVFVWITNISACT